MSSLPRFRRGVAAAWTIALFVVLAAVALLAYLQRSNRELPYRDSFARGDAKEWQAFGGTWELVDGAMRNESDERGAKLLTGSSHWSNYSIDADLMLLGLGGDAGLMVRTSDEEQGVDAYTGYYAGIRTIDNSVVLGRAGHGWTEVIDRLDPKGLAFQPSRWYHLRFLAFGCHLVASVTTGAHATPTTIAATDEDCVRSGRVGLRSYASGGIWRNVVVAPATQHDLNQMLATLRPQDAKTTAQEIEKDPSLLEYYGFETKEGSQTQPSSPNVQPINALRLTAFNRSVPATIRGIVVLASPALFVQDSTGGVAVQQTTSQPLKIGDEVEATGTLHESGFNLALENAAVRVLWEGTPTPAVSVTALQAATGNFDSQFIEVEGRLVRKQHGPNDTLLYDFDAGSESFRAIMNRGRGDYFYSRVNAGSEIRLRGIAVSNASYTHNLVPFALLLRSTDDAVVIAGPPWWSTGHLVSMALGILVLALIGNFFYHRVESWRLRAVLAERERLAWEMHDTLSQSFAGIGFQLEAIREEMKEGKPRLQQQLDVARELVRHSHEETRRSIAVLRPEQPEAKGLLEALTACANRLVEGGSLRVIATSAGDPVSMPLRVTDTLYRIGQEALANAVRHGHPSTIRIRVAYERGSVHVSIGDDGCGFRPGSDMDGFGVRGMMRRAASVSATFKIDSQPAAGTRVDVVVPLPQRMTLMSWSMVSLKEPWRYVRHVAGLRKLDPNTHRG